MLDTHLDLHEFLSEWQFEPHTSYIDEWLKESPLEDRSISYEDQHNDQVWIFVEPEHIQTLRLDIENASKRILELPENWDEEGSEAYDHATVKRAEDFLVENAIRLWELYSAKISAPKILPGPGKSIDILW